MANVSAFGGQKSRERLFPLRIDRIELYGAEPQSNAWVTSPKRVGRGVAYQATSLARLTTYGCLRRDLLLNGGLGGRGVRRR